MCVCACVCIDLFKVALSDSAAAEFWFVQTCWFGVDRL